LASTFSFSTMLEMAFFPAFAHPIVALSRLMRVLFALFEREKACISRVLDTRCRVFANSVFSNRAWQISACAAVAREALRERSW